MTATTHHIDTIIADALATSIRPPSPDAFVDQAGQSVEYLYAAPLVALAERLIARHEQLAHLAGVDIAVLWRAAGGKKNGKAVLGQCRKPSGLLAFYVPAAFVVTLSADHIRDMLLSDGQIEAILAHELAHCDFSGEDDKPAIRGHDLEEFAWVVQEYGLYLADVRRMDEAFRQVRLPVTA